jgi:hypothetical protein
VPWRPKANAIALCGYMTISFGYFGWRLLPHPGRLIVGSGHDPLIFIWSFAWWSHALATATNPFVTHALYAPSGINVVWTASTPGLAVLFSPITLLFGPVVSYNIAAVLLPALAAWTAFLLCRHVTGSVWASAVGGYLFGFSATILDQQLMGHLHVTGVFLIPLLALVVVRYVEADLSARGLAWRLGAILACQLWLSTELALTATLMLALGLALSFWLLRDVRPRLASSLAPIGAGYVLGAALAAPLLAYALVDFAARGTFVTVRDSTELLNYVVPTQMIGLGGSSLPSISKHFVPGGASAYLGLPTLIIVAAYAVRARRFATARFLVAALLLSGLIALGTVLRVDGRTVVGLPWWRAAAHIPGLDNVFPFRFSIYCSLAAAVIVACWTAQTKGRIYPRPYLLPLLALAAMVPAVWRVAYPTFRPAQPARVAFFADGLYKTCLAPGETLAVFPFAGDSILWQAESGFGFRMASNGLQPFPKYGKPLTSFDADRVVWELSFVDYGRPTIDRLLAFAALHHVDRVVSVLRDGYPSRAQMARFGKVQLIGGALVAPACGAKSLATRDLTPYVVAYRAEQLHSRPNIGYCIGLNFNLVPQGLYPALLLQGARRAILVAGHGLTCAAPPAGYRHRGSATSAMNVPADTYAYYAP